jgi:uncharacterized protein involved in outer membrane biogenesis
LSPDPTPDRAPGALRRARDLAAARFDRARLALGPRDQAGRAPAASGLKRPGWRALAWTGGGLAALLLALALFLAFFDWNLARGPIGRFASAQMHRPVSIDGDLKVNLFSWEPSATVEKLTIGNPAWAGPGHTLLVDRLLVQIKLTPLLRGRLVLLRLEATRPDIFLRRDLQGRATWDFSGGEPKRKPLKMPPVRRFVIDDGHLVWIDDARKLKVSATLGATEARGAVNRGFQLVGDGSVNGEAFLLRVLGGPLLNVDPSKPYPFNADIRSGPTRVTAQGDILKPFDLGQLTVNLTAHGPDLDRLHDLTGLAFPNTPPYDLRVRLIRNDRLFTLQNLSGRIGGSDVAGTLSIDTKEKRPFIKADLRSHSLDFRDMAYLFGARPAIPGVVTAAPKPPGPRTLMPDATLKVDRIRAQDAEIHFTADSIHDAVLPLRAADVVVLLDHGLLVAKQLTFDLPQGRIQGRGQLDARPDVPITDVDLRLTGGRIEQLLSLKAGAPITGALIGRIRLRGVGDSVHKAAASANGEVQIVAPGGEIRRAFAELLGIDVTKGLGLLFAKNQDKAEIRCAVADFTAQNGLLTANRVVFDTGPVLATGSGTVNLGTERVDLRIEGHPKEFRLVRLTAPITVKGPILGPPKIGVATGQAIAQGGIAAVLATFASPLAAILPFVDAGLAKDAACGALIAEAGRKGAPVKPSMTAARKSAG